VTEYLNDASGDIDYWGLTHVQAAHHHARLSRMYADRATRYADNAVRYAHRAVIGNRVVMVLAAFSLALAILKLVIA
jgi:hypothetical protein